MRRLPFVAAAALMLALVGCSSGASPGATQTPPQPTAEATTSDPTPAATLTSATPIDNCLEGSYDLIRFVGVGAFGTGEGGDVTSTFDNGSYLLQGAGEDPMKLTIAGQTVDLLVDGTISGNYRVVDQQATFTVRESTGSASLSKGPLKDSMPMEQVGSVLAANGPAGLACAHDGLIVTLQDVRLEFGKI